MSKIETKKLQLPQGWSIFTLTLRLPIYPSWCEKPFVYKSVIQFMVYLEVYCERRHCLLFQILAKFLRKNEEFFLFRSLLGHFLSQPPPRNSRNHLSLKSPPTPPFLSTWQIFPNLNPFNYKLF